MSSVTLNNNTRVLLVSTGGTTSKKTHSISKSSTILRRESVNIQESYVVNEYQTQGILKYRLQDTCDTLQPTTILLPELEPAKFFVSLLQVEPEGVEISDSEFQSSSVESSQNGSNKMIKDNTVQSRHSSDDRTLPTQPGSHNRSEKANYQHTAQKARHRDVKSSSKHKQRTPEPHKIPPDIFKKQLSDTSDIVSPLTLLPNTKRLLEISTWNFNTSLTIPERSITSKLNTLFERNCISNEEENEFDTAELNLMPLGYKPQIDLSKIKRITRKRKNPYLIVSQEDLRVQEREEEKVENECLIRNEFNDGSIGYVRALYDADSPQGQCFFLEDDVQDKEIIVIHDGQETAESATYAHRNIDVLLAAAAENNTDSSVYCHESQQMNSVARGPNPPALDGQRLILLVKNSLSRQ